MRRAACPTAASSPYLPDREGPKRGNTLGLAVRFELPSGDHTSWTALNTPAFPPRTPDDFHAMVSAQRAELPGGLPNPLRLLAFLAPRAVRARRDQGGGDARSRRRASRRRASTASTRTTSSPPTAAGGRFASAGCRWRGARRSIPPTHVDMPPQYLVIGDQAARRARAGGVAPRLPARGARRPDRRPDAAVARDRDRSSTPGSSSSTASTRIPISSTRWVFDPTRMPPGIELSDDPLLHFRSEAYAESHRRRSQRAAAGDPAGVAGFSLAVDRELRRRRAASAARRSSAR